MIKQWHIDITFKWFDLWSGIFVDLPGKALYICLLPTLPIKIWFTEHRRCLVCGKPMWKIAADTGDGWLLDWECEICGDYTEGEIEWPFGDERLTARELELRGFKII